MAKIREIAQQEPDSGTIKTVDKVNETVPERAAPSNVNIPRMLPVRRLNLSSEKFNPDVLAKGFFADIIVLLPAQSGGIREVTACGSLGITRGKQ